MLTIGRPSKDIDKLFDQISRLHTLRQEMGAELFLDVREEHNPYSYIAYHNWYFQQEQSNETGS